jgi:hypothetical protein
MVVCGLPFRERSRLRSSAEAGPQPSLEGLLLLRGPRILQHTVCIRITAFMLLTSPILVRRALSFPMLGHE